MKTRNLCSLRALFCLVILCCPIQFAYAAFTFVPAAQVYSDFGASSQSLAVADNTLVLPGSDSNGDILVYVYIRINGVWVESARLNTPDTQVLWNDETGFGRSLAISPDGNTIFVGDPTAACASDANLSCGAVDIYQKPSGGWSDMNSPSARLVPSTAASQELGTVMAISSDGLTLAAMGDAVYVFTKPTNGWANSTQNAILGTASGTGTLGYGGIVGLAVDGGVVATNTAGQSVLVYVEPGSSWQDTTTATAVLTCSACGFDSGLGDFGSHLAVAGDAILVGAPVITTALIYQEPNTGWSTTSSATAVLQTPTNSNGFASGVGLIENTAVVAGGGTLYRYDEPNSGWSSEPATGSVTLSPALPPVPPPLISGGGSIFVSGSELATTVNAQCDAGLPVLCLAAYVVSDTQASSNYDGLMIDSVSIDDLTTQTVRATSGHSGDELQFDFNIQNVEAPDSGKATFQASVESGSLTAVSIIGGGSCTQTGNSVSCNINVAPGNNVSIQITDQTAAAASQAVVAASLSNVTPMSWDALAASLKATLPLTPVPVVPSQTTFVGAPGSVISNTLPVTYAGKNSLVFKVIQQPADGTLKVDTSTGSFTWTPPNSTYDGVTQFIYQVSDGVYTSSYGYVTIDERPSSGGSGSSSGGGGGGVFGLWELLLLAVAIGIKDAKHP
jgi:Bacterial Ig domain